MITRRRVNMVPSTDTVGSRILDIMGNQGVIDGVWHNDRRLGLLVSLLVHHVEAALKRGGEEQREYLICSPNLGVCGMAFKEFKEAEAL